MVRRPRMVHTPRTVEHSSTQPDEGSPLEGIDHGWALSSPATASAPAADALTTTAASSPAREGSVVPLAGAMRELQLENVHPIRLKLLLEIERTGSISAAAEACAIAQPSASMHIRTLETAMRQTLVTRHGRGSRLTAAGKVVASHADRVLATLDSMRRTLDALDGRHAGRLVVAASLSPSLLLLPSLLRAYSDFNPGVTVNLRTSPSETVVREVARGGADIGIAAEVPTTEPVARRQLLVDELVGIAPPGQVRLDGGSVSLAELGRHTLLVGGESSSTRIVTERYLGRAGYRPTRVWVFDSYDAITRAVSNGLGVSFASRLLVREAVERGELVAFRLLGVERMLRRIYVFESAVRELTPEGAAFVALLADLPSSGADRRERPAATA
jgi:molybdate transport repressor ModE-like protein